MQSNILAAVLQTSNLAETISYLKERKAFGQPLINNQYIHFRLAELHTEVEMFRAMVYAGMLAF